MGGAEAAAAAQIAAAEAATVEASVADAPVAASPARTDAGAGAAAAAQIAAAEAAAAEASVADAPVAASSADIDFHRGDFHRGDVTMNKGPPSKARASYKKKLGPIEKRAIPMQSTIEETPAAQQNSPTMTAASTQRANADLCM